MNKISSTLWYDIVYVQTLHDYIKYKWNSQFKKKCKLTKKGRIFCKSSTECLNSKTEIENDFPHIRMAEIWTWKFCFGPLAIGTETTQL